MKNIVITIARQYGSGGHEIGATIAHDLGIKLYDKEMLKRAAKESGLCEELFEKHDEKPTNSFLYSLIMDTHSLGYSSGTYADMPINHKVFLSQLDAIKKIAEEMGEDVKKRAEKEIDELTKEFTDKIDAEFKAKSDEIMKL